MPRIVKPGYEGPFSEVITAPLFIVELSLSAHVYRLCSFDEPVRLLGRDWSDSNIRVTGPTQKSGGTLTADVTVPYDTWREGGNLMQDILAERPQDRPAMVAKTYFHDDSYLEPIILLNGVIDSVNLGSSAETTKQLLRFTLVSSGNRGGVTPHIRMTAPLLNHVTPAGSIVAFNGARYEIDRR